MSLASLPDKLAPFPDNEEERLEALYKLDILDTLEEQPYDDLTFLAAQICATPISIITLVDRDRQWFKSIYGLNAKETSRKGGFCSSAIFTDKLTIIEDASKDERFLHHPFVTGEPQIKFYAGAPLIFSDNIRLGSLCVIDQTARAITLDQQKALESLARQVVSQLELRLTKKELKATDQSNLAIKEKPKRSETGQNSHSEVLEKIAEGRPLNGAMKGVIYDIENEINESLSSIDLLKENAFF